MNSSVISFNYKENFLPLFCDSEIFFDCEFMTAGTYNFDLSVVQLFQCEWKYSAIFSNLKLIPWHEILAHTCVLHDANADLAIIFHQTQQLPRVVLDTQIALALLTPKLKSSFSDLVARYLGITLDKSQTRTNWQQRPLSKEQLLYAHNDVFFLAQAYPFLVAELKKNYRLSWWFEESFLTAERIKNKKFYWFNLRNASRIFGNKNAIKIAHILTMARENIALKNNISRYLIIPDSLILKLAELKINSVIKLAEWIDENSLMWNELEFIEESFSNDIEAARLPVQENSSLNFAQAKQRDLMISNALKLSEKLNINSAILCNERDIAKLILDPEKPNRLTNSWRKEFLSELYRNI